MCWIRAQVSFWELKTGLNIKHFEAFLLLWHSSTPFSVFLRGISLLEMIFEQPRSDDQHSFLSTDMFFSHFQGSYDPGQPVLIPPAQQACSHTLNKRENNSSWHCSETLIKVAASTFLLRKVFTAVYPDQPAGDADPCDDFGKLAGWLTDGGDVWSIKFTFREPAQHARLPDPRVPEHEQPEQDVVLFGHDPSMTPRAAPSWWCPRSPWPRDAFRAPPRKLLPRKLGNWKCKCSQKEPTTASSILQKQVV